MKYILLILTAALMITAPMTAQDQRTADVDGPNVEFENTTVNYGTILQNSDPLRTFNLTNTGTEPLVITGAKGSCGCTVPSYPKEPVLPGASAEIEVRYDTKRIGNFTKSVTLTTNAVNNSEAKPAGTFLLTIKGQVKPAEVAPGAAPVMIPLDKPEE